MSDGEMTGQTASLTVYPFIAAILAFLPLTAAAQSPQFLGTYRDWNVYKFTDGDQTICYIASEPKKQEGDYTRRDRPAMLVTRRPGSRVVDEVSVQPGYSYLDASEVEVVVDGSREFALFTRGEHAWTKSEQADKDLIQVMKNGSDMTVRGTSIKNTFSLDTYSLLGFTAAYDAMAEACSGEQS
jgi:Invasion associated locus B (IalB) protein